MSSGVELIESMTCPFCSERIVLNSCGRCGSESCRSCLTPGGMEGPRCPTCVAVEERMVEAEIQAHRDLEVRHD